MNAIQLKLQALRNKEYTIKIYPEGLKPVASNSLQALRERVANLSERVKHLNDWRKPEEKVYKLKVRGDLKAFILQARRDLPRINIRVIDSQTLQVEGLAEYRWLQSRL